MSDEDHARPRAFERLQIIDFMTVSIFFVVNTLVGLGVAFVGITPVSYVMVSSLQALVLGILTMLFYSKVRKPGMLLILLNESTASIDPENETIIQKTIDRLLRTRRY